MHFLPKDNNLSNPYYTHCDIKLVLHVVMKGNGCLSLSQDIR